MSIKQRFLEWLLPSRRQERLRKEALVGRASSGHLGPGERAEIFMREKKRRR